MVAPSRGVAGKAHLGCLLTLLILGCGVYIGKDVAAVYWRFYQMQDEVKTQGSFAPALSDKVILDRLVIRADSLGVPIDRRGWSIRRSHQPSEIVIRGEYDDSVVIRAFDYRKVFRFHFVPSTTAPL
jgi:hypothetical protein